ncbi:TetR/AcrR family transcriptional regulator [Hydrogenophaga sp.]|uniref:TetR/AcrR family transcriptional regulator n=1 Tax=Hydrogenophaga sp. TaxID=1904254 RepID=UPI00260FC136|nr:TetR/AcrR family transcriptional regulator [Hydrogenophaga sp.]MCW5653331.1 TetR family transcriptional regulator [Hydrogenophaga sp.]
MAKTRSSGEITQRALREAAIRLIAQDGYHGVSLRTLAEEVGIQAASLYNHIENKQQFLFDLLRAIMEDLVEEVQAEVAQTEGTLAKVCVFVANHVSFHARRQLEVYIGTMELRSLLPEHRAVQLRLREEHEMLLQALIDQGEAEGLFRVPDRRVVTFAILSMTTTLANWYREDGRLSVQDLQRLYIELALRMLDAKPTMQDLLAIGERVSAMNNPKVAQADEVQEERDKAAPRAKAPRKLGRRRA